MKRHLLVAAAASVALAGCVSEERMEMADKGQKLSFDAPALATQTRADFTGEIRHGEYPETEEFVVFAKQYDGNFNAWSSGVDFWTNQGLTVSKEGTTWETKNDYYWPRKPHTLTFAAYSPAVLGQGQPAYGTDGLTITNYVVDDNVSNQIDLLYSDRITNQNGYDNPDYAVPVEFKHALSSVVFSALDNDPYADYTVNSLKIHNLDPNNNRVDFYNKGTFKSNMQDSDIDVKTTSATWTETSIYDTENNKVEYNPDILNKEVSNLSNASLTVITVLTADKSALLMIPQEEAAKNGYVTINYTVKPTNGATYTMEQTVKLIDFKKKEDGTPSIEKWEMGCRYTYVFEFKQSGNKIRFSPSVTEWVDGGFAFVQL